MTSSLVGSEMCIRDRLERVVRCGRMWGAVAGWLCAHAGCVECSRSFPSTASVECGGVQLCHRMEWTNPW
eukprot:7675978-Prorocentrum_lima.AAC.1